MINEQFSVDEKDLPNVIQHICKIGLNKEFLRCFNQNPDNLSCLVNYSKIMLKKEDKKYIVDISSEDLFNQLLREASMMIVSQKLASMVKDGEMDIQADVDGGFIYVPKK